jgi:transposase
MIDQETRKAVYCLYEKGMSIREISHRLKITRNTVSKIIYQQGGCLEIPRKDRIKIEKEILLRLYADCQGRMYRIYEKLNEEEGIKIGYSTLTRLIRELGLGSKKNDRCGQEEDLPGEEMQHDTSSYKVKLGEKQRHVIGSLLYFRYSKMRYLRFYHSFDRFRMKCFFHEALTHVGYASRTCIIDNTNLARLRGTGKYAVIVPEMATFSDRYGFEFKCHEIKHCNRKAGNERGFWTIETNFFPGRKFESLEDLNKQAFEWATVRMANRPVGKSRIIPTHTFEHEKPFLKMLLPHMPAPYKYYTRLVDQYGYVSFDGNFYWVEGTKRFEVIVLEYTRHIEIYHNKKLLIKYNLAADGIKNQVFKPENRPGIKNQPNSRKKGSTLEEKQLRSLSEDVVSYLNFLDEQKGIKKHHFMRQLYNLSKKIIKPIFSKSLQRALKYKVSDIETIERISILLLESGNHQIPFPIFNEEYQNREAFLDGKLSDEADLTFYDNLLDKDNG